MAPLATVVVTADGRVVVAWPLLSDRVGLEVVDRVARLDLAARRLGWRVSLRGAAPVLADLLRLTGLDGVLEALG